MGNILDIYKEELSSPNTNYFILDTKGTAQGHGDVDFISYNWSPSKHNKVKEGDLFIYRRPSKASEISGKFYFFGAGKISKINKVGQDRVRGIITKPVSFYDRLLPQDLDGFKWTFKQKGPTWEHFFNQYGMNQIVKDDFVGIIKLAFTDSEESLDHLEEVNLIQKQQQKNYSVEDSISLQKRRVGHKVFADQVKLNYAYTCAVSGIKTKEFLVASHIVPWAKRKDTRLDPQNGICLSVLLDKAFDKGYITISSDFRVELAVVVKNDPSLSKLLKPYEGKRIRLPRIAPPKIEYLEWHRERIFRNFNTQ
ncbi:HNH endonuclease [Priestia megaterium]|uniref:HNH endonuclease n=1 Tax=Priestia megaterium TaxID=1404 RepID=UPI0024530C94|nr:HNH endonuclease [Priestia megaterium]MDH3186666.1 HNH endonuclease [Priestia megaterium]